MPLRPVARQQIERQKRERQRRERQKREIFDKGENEGRQRGERQRRKRQRREQLKFAQVLFLNFCVFFSLKQQRKSRKEHFSENLKCYTLDHKLPIIIMATLVLRKIIKESNF